MLRTFYFCKVCKVLAIPRLRSQLGRLYVFKQAQPNISCWTGLRLKTPKLLCDTVYPPPGGRLRGAVSIHAPCINCARKRSLFCSSPPMPLASYTSRHQRSLQAPTSHTWAGPEPHHHHLAAGWWLAPRSRYAP